MVQIEASGRHAGGAQQVEPLFAGGDAGITLFRSIDATVTPMGKRLLRAWMLRPSIDRAEIDSRLDAVEARAVLEENGLWKQALQLPRE